MDSKSSGVGAISILGIIFIVLKLCHVIDWPWLWVLAPFWISGLVAIILILIVYLIYK